MNNNKKTTLKNILFTGSLVAGSVLSFTAANATETFKYSELGSGGELRSELLDNHSSDILAFEMDCGEATKTKDAKCGEGKCGDKKADVKKTDAKAGDVKAATTGKMKDAKMKDAKCGEGKCGEKKDAMKKSEKKKDKDGDGKATL